MNANLKPSIGVFSDHTRSRPSQSHLAAALRAASCSRGRVLTHVHLGVGLAAIFAIAGCQDASQHTTRADHRSGASYELLRPTSTTQPADDASPHDPSPPGTAEVLAQKAQAYARNVGPLLPKHGAALDPKPVADSLNPNDLELSPQTAHATSRPARPAAVESVAAVTPGSNTHPLTTSRPDENPAPTPVATHGASIDAIGKQLAQHVHDYPQDLAGQLDYQLLEMLQGESVPQLATLSPLAPEDREVVSALLDGVTNFRDSVRSDNNMLLSRKVRPLLEMADRLRSQAELSIPTVALCKRVTGFGVYDPIEGARFTAGQDTPVIVYCEVENFASQLNDQKLWESKLKLQVVLYEEQSGMEVWRQKEMRPGVDLSRNRRHDFFMAEMIHLPASLTLGRYLLKVSVEDLQVNRIAENTVGIQIAAQ